MLIEEVLVELVGVLHQSSVDVEGLLPKEVVGLVESKLAETQSKRSSANKLTGALRVHIVELGAKSGCYIGKWHPQDSKLHLDPYLKPKIFSQLRGGL